MTTPAPGLVPAEAITAATEAIYQIMRCIPNADRGRGTPERLANAALVAAAPVILAHNAGRLKAQIADEATAICAETVLDAVAVPTARIAELEQLASEMLAAFDGTAMLGRSAYVGSAQIARWRGALAGTG